MKFLVLILALLTCIGCLDTMVVAYSMVSPEYTYRNHPASWNIWGPVQPKGESK